jgi:NAD(P)-dependent dehydrogenase (short-subunit alcohol dehydrogenase family)
VIATNGRRLEGKKALVTGGGSGIGLAVSELFASEGASVILVGRREDRLRAAAEQINRAHEGAAPVSFVAGAVHVSADVERIVAFVDAHGLVDVLVNNAGVCYEAALIDTPEDMWDETIDINLKGPFLLTAPLARRMIEQGIRGSIINTASMDAAVPEPLYAPYNASKAALVSMTRTLAYELGPHGIRVNAVSPGPTRTPLFEGVLSPEELERYVERMLEGMPLRRIARPEEIAPAYLFLASDEASYVTGETLLIDGGRTAAW